ncbi:hypothetical protein G4X40_19730 [Rhodococcus sp. D2-41]|uniref:hypothetical protein n=1 Tax=Speluncibacter jeojiensis TaxID=2710754 RepID=UPI00241022B5|nr:hypothetical protein [Rhodococcus sp. D2-41]MDG3012374.1 hypothetical protein [Rhodococcus sp. D2-41]
MAVQKKARTAKPVIARELALEDFEEQALDALGSVPGITLVLKTGEKVTIPHPMLVDDERQEVIERVQSGKDLDVRTVEATDEDGNVLTDADGNAISVEVPGDTIDGKPAGAFSKRLALAILGEDDYATFAAGGGKSGHVVLAWRTLTEGMDPKASN